MLRAFIAASMLVLTATSAHADPTSFEKSHGPQSANDVCGSLLQSKAGSLFYQSWFKSCMRMTSVEITRQEARASRYRAYASK